MTDNPTTTSSQDSDPADVAAMSSVASALLGTAGQLPAGAGGGRVDGALPPVPPTAALPSNSRYVGVGTAVWIGPDGRQNTYLRRRRVPPPEALATAGWQEVPDGDRIDLLADRTIGDATAFWRLADANLAFDPAEIEVPGRIIRVALPEGFPGAPNA